MPIFKVTCPGGQKRSLVIGGSIEEIVSSACKKLDILSSASCKIVLEEDGTEVEEYETLQTLAEMYKTGPVQLMVLPDGVPWEPVPKRVPLSSIRSEQHIDAEQRRNISPSTPTSSRNNVSRGFSSAASPDQMSQIPPLPWDTIVPVNFEDSATNPVGLSLELVRNIANYMINVLHDTRFGTAGRIAQMVVSKFPKAFENKIWTDESNAFSDGAKDLKIRIYDRVRYVKQPSEKNQRKRTMAETEDGRENPTSALTPDRYGKDQDTYGCVAYEPPLPEGESMLSQQEKKQALLLDFVEEKLGEHAVSDLLAATYASQRICLNRREQEGLSLHEILNDHWPHLKKKTHFYNHASTLIGQDVALVWEENVEKKLPVIYSYFDDYSRKYRQQKNVPKIAREVQGELSKVKDACKQLKSNLPRTLAFLKLLTCYFEEIDLFTLVDPSATEEEVKKAEDSSRPILVVKGMPVYDEHSRCVIVIEETVIAETDSVLEGALLLLLSHCFYGYNYAEKKSSSLEFIQRMLLKINPRQGNKRGRKRKYERNEETTPVVKLMQKIVKFQLFA